ncbi:hypothetical protein BE21_46475 [Sorangium cellulosum]|uniref:Uncharacterized protein n=1 Tax=Sorangium cellulosum TaxID=56 RepID=A0A150TIG7_SORCE|nr:hypothetical protein BE21_46475 [Sorangium cellulosum]
MRPPRSDAPGWYGIAASTSTSQRRDSAASCCRWNAHDSGSTRFGKMRVTQRTRSGLDKPSSSMPAPTPDFMM